MCVCVSGEREMRLLRGDAPDLELLCLMPEAQALLLDAWHPDPAWRSTAVEIQRNVCCPFLFCNPDALYESESHHMIRLFRSSLLLDGYGAAGVSSRRLRSLRVGAR